MAAAAAVRGRRFKWSLELAAAPGGRPRGAAEGRGPLGFAERQLGEGGVHESDKILMEKVGGGGPGEEEGGGTASDAWVPLGGGMVPAPDAWVLYEGGPPHTSRMPGSPLSLQRCWDVALAPLKQIPMNLFIMYMAGNTISIFPAMMVCMMGWRPLQALMSLSATLKALESSSRRALQGLVFLVGNGLGLALALYKCQAMGLLPTRPSDWLAFVAPPQRMEFTGGGLIL
ncbi:hypothetical protein QYF61_007203 [Mycteria americana]|uniref:ER membrane protein complex subunit 4 n=1 Tax=Mycteria americana TaxID=33587 RepID=A0AAN7NHR3_MYCAM|nr:hypothetical protein QYF61_007203 [Mycteria americana]